MAKTVVVIPARGGSKSIPRKNLEPLLGVPLIAYSIEVGRRLSCVSDVIVSTEDIEISKISKEFGAKVAMRPPGLAQDLSRDFEIFVDMLVHYPEVNLEDTVIFLRPTHPIRDVNIIEKAYKAFDSQRSKFDSLRSMKLSSEIIFKTWILDEYGNAKPAYNPELTSITDPVNAPRQILPKTYYQDGYVDIFPIRTVIKYLSTTGKSVLPFIIDDYSKDIDTFQDLNEIASFLIGNERPNWFQIPKRV